jgi:guanine deaminase
VRRVLPLLYRDDREYFELENFYDEFQRPWQERCLPMVHRHDESATNAGGS